MRALLFFLVCIVGRPGGGDFIVASGGGGGLWSTRSPAIWYLKAGIALCSDAHYGVAGCSAVVVQRGLDIPTVVMLEPHRRLC